MIKPNDNRRAGLVCIALVLVTLAIYWPSRHFDFVQYDDPDYVSENLTVQAGITTYGLLWSVADAHAANWHPLTWISHMLDCQLFGLNPGAHHLVNVFVHSANSALLFVLLGSLTGSFLRALFVAALFAWHPLRVESVAWISERKDVLSGFFFLLTLLAYARYAKLKAPNPEIGAPRADSFYWLSLALFTLGLLSKAMLVSLPFVLLLLDFWPLNRWAPFAPGGSSASPNSAEFRNCKSSAMLGLRNWIPLPLLIEKIPFVALSLIVAFITFWAQRSGGAIVSMRSENVVERVANTLTGYLAYLQTIFWPHNLSFLYLRVGSPSVPMVCLAMIVLSGVSWMVVLNRAKHPYLLAGWLWFLMMLLPVSSLFQLGLQSTADRYTYLPGIGLALMAVWGVSEAARAFFAERGGQGWLGALALPALLCSAGLSRYQLAFWQNTETLMRRALELNPHNYVARENLAVFYSRHGRFEEAREQRQLLLANDHGSAVNNHLVSSQPLQPSVFEGAQQRNQSDETRN